MRRARSHTRHGTLSLFAALEAATGRGHRQMLRPPSGARDPRLLERHRSQRSRRSERPRRHGQRTTHKTKRSAIGSPSSRVGAPTTRQPQAPGSAWSSASSPTSPRSKSAAAHIATEELEAPIANSIDATMPSPSPSSGPSPPPTFSPASSGSAPLPSAPLRPQSPQLQNEDTSDSDTLTLQAQDLAGILPGEASRWTMRKYRLVTSATFS